MNTYDVYVLTHLAYQYSLECDNGRYSLSLQDAPAHIIVGKIKHRFTEPGYSGMSVQFYPNKISLVSCRLHDLLEMEYILDDILNDGT